jgi:hypothetical protein
MILPNGSVADKTGGEENLVCRLKDALKVRRKPLGQRELFGDSIECDPPCYVTLLTSHLEQPIEASGDGGGKRGVSGRRQHDRVPGLDVGPKDRG